MLRSAIKTTLLLICLILIAAGCAVPKAPLAVPAPPTANVIIQRHTAAPIPSPSALPTETWTPTPYVTATPTLPPTPAPIGFWMSPLVPGEFQATFETLVSAHRLAWVSENTAQVKFMPATPDTPTLASWLYVPVVPFPTVADDVSWAAIQQYWHGDPAALASFSGNGKPPTFISSPQVLAWLTVLLGAPAATVPIKTVAAESVAATLWSLRPAAWSVVPFQQLDPSEKALMLDGANMLSPAFSAATYPLQQTFALSGSKPQLDQTADAIQKSGALPLTNRDGSRLTVLVMTGTTALTRATAYQMEQTGITLPARDILPFLADANIVHTSNEVSFAADCPYPNPAGGLTFCARDSYLDLLKAIHLNIVELTGNHMNDWGTAAFSHTLDVYDANGILTFGGGRNTEDARDPAIITQNGNTLAFLGCNPVGPNAAWATDTTPGAAPCDDGYLAVTIPILKASGALVIMTLQYQEYYEYDIPADQSTFFSKYAAMGADIVFGSQAHHPQGFAFVGGKFIHYGTGNLFFDQMDDIETRQMFADKLIFYNGKHISTTLFTGISEDYSRPRPMTAAERSRFLATIFKASGW